MKHLWAPWRMEFLLGDKKSHACPFCELPKQQDDRKNLILKRLRNTYIIMNRYPYNNGHLLVLPLLHEKDFTELNDAVVIELQTTMQIAVAALKKSFSPDGFNIGMNLGSAAGAGIPDHLHYHVIPRWVGDTNFMPILNDVKVMGEYLHDTYDRLITAF